MKRDAIKDKVIHIELSKEILKSSKLTIDEVKQHFTDLAQIFKQHFTDLVPTTIRNLSKLEYIVSLSKNLKKLRECEGFEEHISKYKGEQIRSNYFVTSLAGFLVERVDKLVLEPEIEKKKKRPDIYVNFRGEEVYVECKVIETKQFDYYEEHKHMFEVLRKYIASPHQVSITYRRTLSDEELKRLGETLRKRVPLVKREGNIIDNEDLEVNVIPRSDYGDKRFTIIMGGITESLSENCSYPNHVFFKDGVTMSLSGPKVDYSKILRNKLEKSRPQSDVKKPYVLAIDATYMLGELTGNLRFLSTRFQPDRNTRFSGVLLARYTGNLEKNPFEFKFVSNPYAKYPVSKEFELLFKKRS
jgi:hypothetical protein